MQAGETNGSFFIKLRGSHNALPMLLCEPMWGIPFNLFSPYLSLYMAALGCTALQIGAINTSGMVLQVVFALLAPPITDRLGRNRTTLVFNLIAWSGSVLILLFAGNFWFFLAAMAVQAIQRVVHVSWNCLLIEDTDKTLIVRLFSWFTIAGLLAALFAPIGVELVRAQGVVPAMRWMLGAAFVLMTAMFFLRNAFTRETSVGRARMEQARHEHVFRQVADTFRCVGEIRKSRTSALFFGLSAVFWAAATVKGPFFALLLTDTLHLTAYSAGYFSAASSLVMLLVYLFAQPVLARFRPKAPLTVGLILCAAGSLLLLPSFQSFAANLTAVIASVVLSALGTAVAQPLIDGTAHGSMNNEKRSGMTSILIAVTMLGSAPFGFIGGWLFGMNARIPFAAAGMLYVVCAVLLAVFFRDRVKAATANIEIEKNADI